MLIVQADMCQLVHEREPEVVVAIVANGNPDDRCSLWQLEGATIHLHGFEPYLDDQHNAKGACQDFNQPFCVFKMQAELRDFSEAIQTQAFEASE
ncbi:hypothetical protein D9M71_699790 [compost metagenome]